MAYRFGNRSQVIFLFLPPCIEDYVPKDAPVRAYDAFIEALNFNDLGIMLNPCQVGNPQYDPKAIINGIFVIFKSLSYLVIFA